MVVKSSRKKAGLLVVEFGGNYLGSRDSCFPETREAKGKALLFEVSIQGEKEKDIGGGGRSDQLLIESQKIRKRSGGKHSQPILQSENEKEEPQDERKKEMN